MRIRILTGFCCSVLLLITILLSDTYVFPVVAGICAFISVFEILRCVGVQKNYSLAIPLYILALALPVFSKDLPFVNNPSATYLMLIIIMMFYLLSVVVFAHGTLDIRDASLAFLISFYIIGGFTSLILLRYTNESFGKYIYLLVFIAAWVTDSFAYFTGIFLGRHKLIPEISPKKTVEGSIGGVIFCILGFLLYGYIMETFVVTNAHVNYVVLAIGGFLASICAQIGDLCMSALKRKYDVKDFGKILPGHGGLLDRFDSMVPVALVLVIVTSLGTVIN